MTWPSGLDVSRGDAPGVSDNHKFGRNSAVAQTFVPVCGGGVYRTPQVGGATALRVKAGGNAADSAAGAGAQSITLECLDETCAFAKETIATAGASASDPTTTTFIRLFRVYVAASGTYATQSAGSHFAEITVEDVAGTEDWAVIDATGFPRGQSQIGIYSVPLNREAYVASIELSTETNKLVDLNFYSRGGILDTAAPYQPMRLRRELVGITGNSEILLEYPIGPFPELTDFGFMARVDAQTADVSIEFTIVEVLKS